MTLQPRIGTFALTLLLSALVSACGPTDSARDPTPTISHHLPIIPPGKQNAVRKRAMSGDCVAMAQYLLWVSMDRDLDDPTLRFVEVADSGIKSNCPRAYVEYARYYQYSKQRDPARAKHYAKMFLERFPDNEMAPEMREVIDGIE